MNRFRSFLLLALLTLLVLPTAVSAHDFHQNESLFFNAKTRVYRQKSAERPWQLVALPAAATVKQSVSFGEAIYLVVEEGALQSVWRQQDRPLQFSRFMEVEVADRITLKLVGDRLVIFSNNGLTAKTQLLKLSGSLVSVEPALIESVDQVARLAEIAGELHYFQQSGATVTIWRYNNGWVSVGQSPCQDSQLIVEPLVGLFCQDGTIIYRQSADNWATLTLAPLAEVYNSTQIIGGWDRADERLFHIWNSGVVTTVQLPTLPQSLTDQVAVVGRRVLLRKIDSNWHELSWQNASPVIAEIAGSAEGSVIKSGDDEALFINSVPPLFSTATSNWQSLTVVGQFSSARQTPLGHLVWNTGSLTQFAPTGSTVFIKVNSWSSTTSPIQAVEIGPTASFVSVITQSGTGNVNLYKTTDFTHWSRITLPTKPTYSPTISQARALTAGSLVELSGVVTVGPKVVDSEVLYLEDTTAGIQVYLSQTTDVLPTTTKINAIATGEISSSQTKRVLLDTLADLELGSNSTWTEPNINADQAVDYQGRLVGLKGSVTDLETDYLTLGSLKLHFTGAKSIFQKDDLAQWSAVIDWNSSSGKVEAWTTSSNYQLLSRVQAPSQPSAVTPLPISNATSSSSTAKKTTAVTKKTVSTSVTSPTTTTISSQPQPTDAPVIVGAVQNKNTSSDNQTISMSAVSLLAGLLSFRGRRLRRWLPS
ncbi:MAG: hypothetical protein Q8Q05_01145 [bacterium]|nr:hypothetical protein [bacterium]